MTGFFKGRRQAGEILPEPRTARMPPVLHMASPTHHANLMIRYMVGTKLRDLVPDLIMSRVDLPYWSIHLPEVPVRDDERICEIRTEQDMPFERLRYLSDGGLVTRFDWLSYGQRLENFPPVERCRDLFRSAASFVAVSDDEILCPVRGAEILDAIHPGYTSVPVDFYEEIATETGLRPVFMGQLADNSYTRALRGRFPLARFLPPGGVVEDFQTIRNAANIVVPISTFGWLAAWLSRARHIVLPVFGIFDRRCFGLHDLLPLADPRYAFYQFPQQAAVPLEEMARAHAEIRGRWRKVEPMTLTDTSL